MKNCRLFQSHYLISSYFPIAWPKMTCSICILDTHTHTLMRRARTAMILQFSPACCCCCCSGWWWWWWWCYFDSSREKVHIPYFEICTLTLEFQAILNFYIVRYWSGVLRNPMRSYTLSHIFHTICSVWATLLLSFNHRANKKAMSGNKTNSTGTVTITHGSSVK